ncbi:MAG TPA: peptidoglycan DD-metalloendopeptidase family protein [Chitinophagaceae bacterium]|nr:peptidoglycan DD-metalloendopeptidase family protein [Chitinophagaceae bacterium]
MKRILAALVLFFGWIAAFSQRPSPPAYPRNYFRNPLDLPMEIVANMGELRPNHWHMGLDIRTNQKENQPVHAAADGYIAHVGIRPQSFGRYIIINHPNGLSTLYAHLNDFYPELEQYVSAQQYKKESWALELDFSPQQFRVSKGQFMAKSGNTGGSQGPHLHFEIFNTRTSERLNPLLFGFPLHDKVPPSLVKLALYDRGKSVFAQSPRFFTLKKTDSGYIIPKLPVLKTGLNKISFAIQAYDRISGSANADGIYAATLLFDDKPQVNFVIDSIDYEETGFMNAHIDYKYRYNGGAFLQHLSRLPGDRGGVYHQLEGDGVLELSDTAIHTIHIEVQDAYQNMSVLGFRLQYDDNLAKQGGLPPNPDALFVPNQVNVFEKNDFEIYLPEGCLYDSLQPVYLRKVSPASNAVSAIHQFNDASVPVHNAFSVRIRPDRTIPAEWKDKLVIQRVSRTKTTRKASWQGQWLSARFDDFGSFQAFADLIPPTINELGKGDTVNLSPASRILFTPTDNFGIKSFRAELNGEWLRFTNDKGRNWIYRFDERCPYGTHELKVIVEDLVGNITTKSWWFKRGPYTPPKKKAVKKGKSKKRIVAKKPVAKKISQKKNR